MIPKIIHQSYRNQECVEMCPTLKYCQSKAIELHEDFEYKFYSDEDMFNYMQSHFPEFWDRFFSLPKKIMKVDMFRYFLMYGEGGVYADLDYLFFKPFDIFTQECILTEEFTGIREFKGINVSNCIFASVPKFNFWIDLIEASFEKIKNFKPIKDYNPLDVLNLTGPLFINDFYQKYTKKENILVIEKNYFNSEDFQKNKVINSFKSSTSKTKISTCFLTEDEKFLEMIEKFKKSEDKKYYGIHLHTNSWIGAQWHKYMKLFNGIQNEQKTDSGNGNL
jgi:mannosyltransferase OCH1-like enzyme